ncbi:uncharacterized protein Z518_03291 [Rhinocladiella mackenziei CBS 650.93]|uniref:mRNA decay factor PAT1 domain-containing protein n=1 Tax=Rhinocladiella mackenziei CBS 650.93 TaxID=1442369 RepID=A0A0D2IRM2_9EURO|nr:uncharacterized protein Z518_03291 [Rhinocladiella mackenziei CBS 650.93]KIX08634.1 hypothetical protein Z518_03291 [Rhinocladiella mackenziei CBS 650.93]
MSFFGFDSTLPRDKSGGESKGIFEHTNPFNEVAKARKLQAFQGNEEEILDFEDTYDGLGDQLEETGDDFNDDTFGGGAEGATDQGNVGKNFDFFGNTAQVSDAIDEEHLRFNLQHPTLHQAAPVPPPKPKKTGYEKYQDPGYIPDIQAKSGAWGSKSHSSTPSGDNRISTARTSAPAPSASAPAASSDVKKMSLEEVEAALLAQSQGQQPPFPQPPPQSFQFPAQHMQQPPPHQPYQPTPQSQPGGPIQQQQQPPQLPPPSVSPMRHSRMPSQPRQPQQPRQILQNPNRARHSPQPSIERVHSMPRSGPPQSGAVPIIAHPQQLMELSEGQRRAYLEEDAKRAKRNHKIFLLSRGNGLMTPQDKNFITRIQLQQLVTATGNSADPNPEAALNEDFYYQVYSQIRGAPRQHPTQPLGHFAQTYLLHTGTRMGGRRQHLNGDNHMQRMQQQVQRAVEAAKLKPKNKQLIIEGSLGKISFSNAKTPKPLLNIKRQENPEIRPTNGKRATASGEGSSGRKTILKNIEAVYTTLMRLEDNERQMPPPPTEGDADSIQAHLEWHQKMQGLNKTLWQDLKVLDPIVPGSSVVHPFIAFLSFAKGKKAIPRVFRQIDQEQRVTILTMIVIHLDQLDVVKDARPAPGDTQPPPHVREEIELFSQAVMPCLLGYISEAPINIVIGLLGLLIDHTNLATVAQTKIGLGMMTILLSRAELVKETGSVADQDWQQWTTLYSRLFDMLEPLFSSLFPGPVNSGDDMYVWQFLAAVGIGASPEQQQRLVIGVKDRVMETVLQSKTLPAEMSSVRLGNVNLFMRAIGLDVEMLG